jgi:hypothetical protein
MVTQKTFMNFKQNEEPKLTFGQSMGDWFGSCCCSSSASANSVEVEAKRRSKDARKIGKQ